MVPGDVPLCPGGAHGHHGAEDHHVAFEALGSRQDLEGKARQSSITRSTFQTVARSQHSRNDGSLEKEEFCSGEGSKKRSKATQEPWSSVD